MSIVALASVAAAAIAIAPVLAAQQTPNIVLLYADDMGYGDLRAQNPESKIPTPHLDRLAAEGVRFTDAHSSSGICTPSRYALLSGRYHWRKFHDIVRPFGPSVFDSDRLTLPEMLRERGYATACIGKWHLGWDWAAIRREGAQPDKVASQSNQLAYRPKDFDWSLPIPDGPCAHGFDHYFGDDVPNFPPYAWIEDDRVVVPPKRMLKVAPPPTEGSPETRPGPMQRGWRLDAVMPTLTERAVAWIDARKESPEPFFLYFPFTAPHAPIVPAEPYQGSSDAGGYGDFVTQTDATVGAILDALDGNGLSDSTLVLFTSDNGPERYAFERVRKYEHRSTGPLRGLKRDLYEGGHRVPMLLRWPGVTEAGRVCDQLVSQIDLMATLAAITGSELAAHAAEDSHDLSALWRGGSDSPRRSLVHNTQRDRYAIRSENWVLIDAPSGAVSPVPEWFADAEGYTADAHPAALYDLTTDLGQRRNRFAEHAERVELLRERLRQTRVAGEIRALAAAREDG